MRWLLLLTALISAAQAAEPRLRVLVLTGRTDVPNHYWNLTTPFLRDVLERTGRFEVKVLEELRGITAETLAPYDALILNYNGPRWGRTSEEAVEQFIRSGKGMVAFHGVSYGPFFDPAAGAAWPAYADMIGSTWKPENIGHSMRHVFPVKWTDREHPISRGLDATFLANDELYHRMDLRPNVHVLATAYSDPAKRGTGRDEPIIWTVPFGQGRVVHITLGHDLSAMHQTGFVTSFARSLEWVATGNVTLPTRIEAAPVAKPDAARVLLVTGGHGYPAAFYTLFEGYDDIVWWHATSQKAAFRPDLASRYDVIVFHDMGETIGDEEKANLEAFVEAGKGVVSIHHAIVDYTSWPWWYENVIGGKYYTQPLGDHAKSAYKEGVDMLVTPVAGVSHPVTRGVGPIPVRDEVYSGMWHSSKIAALMETDHPLNDKPVVYIGPHPKARVVYIQLGHGEEAIRHPGYRRLVHNAILWTAGRTK
jgi:uncharacterized protein